MTMFVQSNTINMERVKLYFWPKYHQSGISMKTTIFFCELDFIDFMMISVVFTDILAGKKIENLGWYL